LEEPTPLLSALMESDDLPSCPLTPALEQLHGSRFGLRTPCVYANFVSTVDGVVAFGHDYPDAGSAISGQNAADRFLMGLLRACAEAVVLGAGTLRTTPGHRWTPGDVYPDAAEDFAVLRERLGRAPDPRLVVVTASGDLDIEHPALAGALVLTGDTGARRLEGRLPEDAELRSLGPAGTLSGAMIMEAVHADGHHVVLTEGGPRLITELLRARVLDELFLTVSPILAGRSPGSSRVGLVDGLEYPPAELAWMRLLTVHRSADHLFLRYRLS
jgi:riboflavin biosynthesis pyrimidine reductase